MDGQSRDRANGLSAAAGVTLKDIEELKWPGSGAVVARLKAWLSEARPITPRGARELVVRFAIPSPRHANIDVASHLLYLAFEELRRRGVLVIDAEGHYRPNPSKPDALEEFLTRRTYLDVPPLVPDPSASFPSGRPRKSVSRRLGGAA